MLVLALSHTASSLAAGRARSAPAARRRPAAAAPARRATSTLAHRRPTVAVMTTLSGGIKLDSSPSEAQLKELGVSSWPTWGCEASKFPWSYDSAETAYVLKGRVVVTPDGGEPVEVKAGDLVTFPAGMSCTWDVQEAIHKHYNFH